MSTSGEINSDIIIYIIYYNLGCTLTLHCALHHIHNKRQAAIIYNLHLCAYYLCTCYLLSLYLFVSTVYISVLYLLDIAALLRLL